MERTQEEIFQEENKLIAGRIQKIAETIKEANPQADCFGTSLLFFSKDNSPIKGIPFMEIYLEKLAERGFLFDLPDDFDYPVYSLSLRHEDLGGDFIPPDATVLDHARIMWIDRNYRVCVPGHTYLFTLGGRSTLINHAYEDELSMEVDEMSYYDVTYRVDLDTIAREFSSRKLDLGDYEKVGLVLKLIESGQFYPSPRPLPAWIKS